MHARWAGSKGVDACIDTELLLIISPLSVSATGMSNRSPSLDKAPALSLHLASLSASLDSEIVQTLDTGQ